MFNKTAMNKIGFLLILLVITFFGCSDKKRENLSPYKTLISAMLNSNMEFSNQSSKVIMELKKEISDPKTTEKATIWLIKAELIRSKTTEIISYIDSLNAKLKKETGNKQQTAFKEDDPDAVWNLFSKKAKGKELENRIQKYGFEMQRVDPLIYSAFKQSISANIMLPNLPENSGKSFTESHFKDVSTLAALAILFKIQNSIRIEELKLVEFCNAQVPK